MIGFGGSAERQEQNLQNSKGLKFTVEFLLMRKKEPLINEETMEDTMQISQ